MMDDLNDVDDWPPQQREVDAWLAEREQRYKQLRTAAEGHLQWLRGRNVRQGQQREAREQTVQYMTPPSFRGMAEHSRGSDNSLDMQGAQWVVYKRPLSRPSTIEQSRGGSNSLGLRNGQAVEYQTPSNIRRMAGQSRGSANALSTPDGQMYECESGLSPFKAVGSVEGSANAIDMQEEQTQNAESDADRDQQMTDTQHPATSSFSAQRAMRDKHNGVPSMQGMSSVQRWLEGVSITQQSTPAASGFDAIDRDAIVTSKALRSDEGRIVTAEETMEPSATRKSGRTAAIKSREELEQKQKKLLTDDQLPPKDFSLVTPQCFSQNDLKAGKLAGLRVCWNEACEKPMFNRWFKGTSLEDCMATKVWRKQRSEWKSGTGFACDWCLRAKRPCCLVKLDSKMMPCLIEVLPEQGKHGIEAFEYWNDGEVA